MSKKYAYKPDEANEWMNYVFSVSPNSYLSLTELLQGHE